MIYKTHESLGNFNFQNSLDDILNKIKSDFKKGRKVFMGDSNPTINLLKEKILIVFSKDSKSIEYIEIEKGNLIFNGINIFQTKYSELEKKLRELDDNLELVEGGFNSYKCGLGIYRGLNNGKYSIYPKNAIVFNKDYKNVETPDVDDIINFYLGKPK